MPMIAYSHQRHCRFPVLLAVMPPHLSGCKDQAPVYKCCRRVGTLVLGGGGIQKHCSIAERECSMLRSLAGGSLKLHWHIVSQRRFCRMHYNLSSANVMGVVEAKSLVYSVENPCGRFYKLHVQVRQQSKFWLMVIWLFSHSFAWACCCPATCALVE